MAFGDVIMRKTRRILVLLLAALVLLPVFAFAAEDNGGALDYGLAKGRASAGTASERLPRRGTAPGETGRAYA